MGEKGAIGRRGWNIQSTQGDGYCIFCDRGHTLCTIGGGNTLENPTTMTFGYLSRRLLPLLLITYIPAGAQEVPSYTVLSDDSSTTGYYFLCPAQTGRPMPDISPFHLILDGNGSVVYYRKVATGNTGDFKLQSNGMISYYQGNNYYFLDATFRIIDSASTGNGVQFDPHDFLLLPNGNYLMMGSEQVVRDLRDYPLFNGNATPGDSDAVVESVVLQEVRPDGVVVFEWRAIDHFDLGDVDPYYLSNPSVVDWTHSNAVALDGDGNYLLSSRHFNEITKIDRNTGAVIWRFGGKRNQFNVTNDSALFLAQHDCRKIANGNLTLFDNGRAGSPVHPAAAKEYELDESTMTAALVWSHVEDSSSHSRAIGNAQRLSNGNTLINYGLTVDSRLLFNVVSPDNRAVFALSFDDTLRSYRVYHYDDLPWRLNRPRVVCYDSGGTRYLDAGPGHSRYLWSTGDTTRNLAVVRSDTFVVFVPRGAGMIASEPYIVNDPLEPCSAASVHRHPSRTRSLHIVADRERCQAIVDLPESLHGDVEVTLVDVNGRTVSARSAAVGFDRLIVELWNLPSGLYVIQAGPYVGKLLW